MINMLALVRKVAAGPLVGTRTYKSRSYILGLCHNNLLANRHHPQTLRDSSVVRPSWYSLTIRKLSTSRRSFAEADDNKKPDKQQSDPRVQQTMKTSWNTGGPITWKSLTIGGSILGALYLYTLWLKEQKRKHQELERSRSFGKPAIGGEFELVDAQGKLRSSKEWSGKWMLIYFGFTNCPDICPEELDKLATVIEKITKDGDIDLVPLFISVDPERDTPENVGKYLAEFSPKFIGLTGTKEQVEKATRAYRVYYSAGPKDKDNDYIVDHTIISYLINPKGDLADYFGQTKTVEDIEASIRRQHLEFNKKFKK